MIERATKQKAGPHRALVVGASGRMGAAMLSRLGFECSVVDLYGDQDSLQICAGRVTKVQKLDQLPEMELLVREHDFAVFTGGLEGCPVVARQIARWTKRAFTSPDSIEKSCSLDAFNAALRRCGIDRYPFLAKPIEGSAACVAKDLSRSNTARLVATESHHDRSGSHATVYQEFIAGDSVALIFVAQQGTASFLGGTHQQTHSLSWTGSVSGLDLRPHEEETAGDFANAVSEITGISGAFGIDFIRNNEGIYPVDINPRLPASAEIIGDHVLQQHLQAFDIETPNPGPSTEAHSAAIAVGKRVIFNRSEHSFTFRTKSIQSFPRHHERPNAEESVADIPAEGEVIGINAPVLTVFARGSSPEKVHSKLSALESRILRDFTVNHEELPEQG